MITGLDHIGIAVNKLDEALSIYQTALGLKLEKIRTYEQDRLKAALLRAGETKIELMEPLDKEGPVAKFIEKRGEGVQHISLKVTNIEAFLIKLKENGITLVDEKPRIGVDGGKVAFIHPKSTKNVLIELCEK